jgi:hypothetical protein
MGKTFREWSIEQRWLLPPSVQELNRIALSAIRTSHGRHPEERSDEGSARRWFTSVTLIPRPKTASE